MQPDGPLAQLARPEATSRNDEWFNDPAVPWASPAPVPSDAGQDNMTRDNFDNLPDSDHPPRLGSPFGNHHTWGPSHSRQQDRPSTNQSQPIYEAASVPRLRSPVQLHGTFPANQKRRAQHQLEDVFSPEGLNSREAEIEEMSAGPSLNTRRRVRLRGFSLGTDFSRAQGQGSYTEPEANNSLVIPYGSDDVTMDVDKSSPPIPAHGESMRRLGSPFAGISSRPTRIRGRHLTSLSLSSYDLNDFASIDQRLDQWRDDPFR